MELRSNLRLYWDSIVAVLQKCYQYAHTVTQLTRVSDRVEMVPLLRECVQLCEGCRGMVRKLVPMHDTTMVVVQSNHFVTLIVGGRDSLPYSSQELILRFENAGKDLRKEADNMATFFDGQHDTCERYLDVTKNYTKRPNTRGFRQISRSWDSNEANILSAIGHLRRMCEAVKNAPEVVNKESGCIIV